PSNRPPNPPCARPPRRCPSSPSCWNRRSCCRWSLLCSVASSAGTGVQAPPPPSPCAARISCYTGRVEKTRQNVTLVVEEDLLLAARKVALDQRTSVNQLVREYLSALVEEPSRRRLARARLREAFETGLVEIGDRTWSRDELYDR